MGPFYPMGTRRLPVPAAVPTDESMAVLPPRRDRRLPTERHGSVLYLWTAAAPVTDTADPAADFLATVPPHSVDRSDEWWAGYRHGMRMANMPTIGAVRRLRGYALTDDPQFELMTAIAAEVESVRRALGRGARVDEIRGRALRLARVCEGEQRGEL